MHPRNSTAGINLSPLATTGAVTSTGNTSAAPVRSATTATTASVNLLHGLIRATAVKAASATTATLTGYATSSTGTTLTALVVAGTPIKANAAPNTRITVAGFGYLLINEQVKRTNSLTVNALHLVVTTANKLGVPVGATVTVSHAVSGLAGPVAGVLGGYGYGTKANTGARVVSGETFEAFLPCLGTGGVLRTNTGAGLHLGTALSTGTITNTSKGTITATSATGETTSTVQAATLLNAVVKATVVKADAHANTNGASYSFTDSGSRFGSLSVAGHPAITANVAPNTTITPGSIHS